MTGGGSRVVSVKSWRARGTGSATAALSGCCRRIRSDKAKGLGPNGAKRTVRSKTATPGATCQVIVGSARGRWPNEPLYVTATRWRFGVNLKGLGLGGKR